MSQASEAPSLFPERRVDLQRERDSPRSGKGQTPEPEQGVPFVHEIHAPHFVKRMDNPVLGEQLGHLPVTDRPIGA